jgi:hypothetical protein
MGDQFAADYRETLAPVAGQVVVLNCNTTANSLNLANCGVLSVNAIQGNMRPELQGTSTGLVQRFVEFTAVGNTVYVCFNGSNAGVTGNYAPNAANFGTNVLGGGIPIAAGVTKRWLIHPDTSWLGYVGSNANAVLTISASSRGF